jgi:hypothetical protein
VELPLLLLNAMLASPGSAGLVREAVGWREEEGYTLLHRAAACGSQQLVARLLKAGADRDAADADGATPLWFAAAGGHAHLVPLLATPANINRPAGWDQRRPLLAGLSSDGLVAALLDAGALVDMQDSANNSPVYRAALSGRTKVFALLLAALRRECQQGHQPHDQQQQQQQQQGQARLVELVAAAIKPRAQDLQHAPRCTQLLGVVLDVLGPEVAGQVCLQVQQQLLEQPQETDTQARNCLVEALLLGWVEAEERLHAAWQPLVARLQRLVPGVLAEAGQQTPWGHGEQESRWSRWWRQPQILWQQGGVPAQLVQLVQQSAAAATAGQEHEALRLLGVYVAAHLQQQQQLVAGAGLVGCSRSTASEPSGSVQQLQVPPGQPPGGVSGTQSTQAKDVLPLRQLVHEALQQAARLHVHTYSQAGNTPGKVRAACFYPPGVSTTFLAAWVGARRQLQQLPQEVARTVVAAVKAAQQPRHHQQQQQQGCVLQ